MTPATAVFGLNDLTLTIDRIGLKLFGLVWSLRIFSRDVDFNSEFSFIFITTSVLKAFYIRS